MSTEYTPLRNKYFCNICKVSFEKGRDAIQMHERSQKHSRNKDRETKFQMRKIVNREQTEEEKYEQEVKYLNERNQRRYNGAPPPEDKKKPTKPGAPGAPGGVNRDSGYGVPTGGPGGPAQKQKKKEEYSVVNRDLGISLKPSEMGLPGASLGGAWTLKKDEDTGRVVFYNKIAGTTHEERPRGVKLSPEDEKIWERYQANPTQNLDVLLDPTMAEGTAGQWEEVAVEENFYVQNAIDERLLDVVEEPEYDEGLIFDEKLDQMDDNQMNELLDLDKPEHGKSIIKSKTDKLKQLIETNFEIVSKPTFSKESDILFKRSLDNRGFDGDEELGKGAGNNLFKKKKVQGEKMKLKLGFEDELADN